MRAPPWKSGASAPRKRFEINAGFSPGGHSPIDDGLFPHPRKPWECKAWKNEPRRGGRKQIALKGRGLVGHGFSHGSRSDRALSMESW